MKDLSSLDVNNASELIISRLEKNSRVSAKNTEAFWSFFSVSSQSSFKNQQMKLQQKKFISYKV